MALLFEEIIGPKKEKNIKFVSEENLEISKSLYWGSMG